jgi:hypothetical protein
MDSGVYTLHRLDVSHFSGKLESYLDYLRANAAAWKLPRPGNPHA